MFNRLLRTAFALTVLATAVSCSSNDNNADGYTLRVGATSVTGTPAGSLGWDRRRSMGGEDKTKSGMGRVASFRGRDALPEG